MSNVDKEKIKRAVRDILEAIGEDPDREGLIDTPDRVARMYEEIFAGLHEDPKKHLKTISFSPLHSKNWDKSCLHIIWINLLNKSHGNKSHL